MKSTKLMIFILLLLPFESISFILYNSFSVYALGNTLSSRIDINSIIYPSIIDNNYSSKLFKENSIYSINKIESKLKTKLLHNKYIDYKLFKADYIKNKDNQIAKIIFENVKGKKNQLVNIPLCIIVNTKYSDEDDRNYLDIIENTEVITYYINSLNTNAYIMLSKDNDNGPMFAFFSFNNVIYELYMNREEYKIDYLYEVLESFN